MAVYDYAQSSRQRRATGGDSARLRASRGEEGGAQQPTQHTNLQLRDLSRLLATLSKEQRQVLLLVTLEEFTYEETAKICRIPIGTVMSRLARGRERLRQMMAEETALPLRRVK